MIKEYQSIISSKAELDSLVRIIDFIRPGRIKESDIEESSARIRLITKALQENGSLLNDWSTFLKHLLSSYNPGYLYRERSFFGNTNLFSKFWKLLKLKFLPKSIPANEMDILLDLVFQRKWDYKWVKEIPGNLWSELFESLGLRSIFIDYPKTREKLKHSIIHISYRITALGMDSDILNKIPVLNDQNSPFLIQNTLIMHALGKTESNEVPDNSGKQNDEIFKYLNDCKNHIILLRENKRTLGISMHLTYISRRLLQQIDRLNLLLRILNPVDKKDFYRDFAQLFREMLEYQEVKNSIRKLMKESVNLLAFEIVEHTAQKGEKYIAGTSQEYWKFLTKSMLGGLVIAIFATFKIQLDKLDVSPLGEGLLYGINYSICFVLVYMLGGIIATKQPAMTSSSIVQSIDRCTSDSADAIKNLIIKVTRSQFVSFVGNLILAFPMAILIGMAFPVITNDLLLNNSKAHYLIEEIQPIAGSAWYFAGIAGVILSLSGLISGYFDNKVIYSNISDRVVQHPVLLKNMTEKYRVKLANYILKNSGSLAGNISLGLMLGLAGSIGYFTGLPLDIRHVAFSSANLGFALESNSFVVQPGLLSILVIGVLGIGLINFIVSFGVTFWIAMRSRNVSFSLFKKLIMALTIHFFTRPHHFLFPFKLNNP